MGFSCGIVGLPNVGKSTLFNALTNARVEAKNFLFCTIEPNTGVVPVPDPRLDRLAKIVRPERVIPSVVEFVDIAGLVAGASEGEGLGNQFLAYIRETQAIAHVVRCFEDENITHVSGDVSPANDIGTIDTELALADLDTAGRVHDRLSRMANAGDKDARKTMDVVDKVIAGLDEGISVRNLDLDERARDAIEDCHFITAKPVMYIANVAEDGFADNPLLAEVASVADSDGSALVPVCNKIESEIAELEDSEKLEFIRDLGVDEPGLNRVIRAGYHLLGLQSYFTAGPKEARAWAIPTGTLAPAAAGVIHTDFEKGFIRAEVVAYQDFVKHGGELAAKEAGRWRLEGKDYVIADGDVVHFRFNV